MEQQAKRKREASVLRTFRQIHRVTASLLFLFFFLMGITGILLGMKKHSGELIQDKTYQGSSTELAEWLPLDSLYASACKVFRDSISPSLPLTLERMDVRMDKGMVKFIFEKGFWGIQVDGATGELLHIERRRSDFIEMIHDGSIIDHYLGIRNGLFKLIYSTIMGLALLLFTITGFWLWYRPRQLRRKKNSAIQ
ncbi:MAG: PepSY domain-containing protein [Bacteroidales bacterium]|jgi:uncharacterized iron-regulated membrane protein|nr:PepSY domain-containing protein [Bacteroidales bacterium]NLM91393.1 PepSY domain-containing protein [Bacteroidales bacterium]